MATKRIEIVNKLGLHARAASKFVKLASTFESEITVRKGERVANGKSIMGLMMLAASRGSTIEVSAEGPDEAEALAAIEALVARRFDEEA